jgi:hypothetical protein
VYRGNEALARASPGASQRRDDCRLIGGYGSF